MDKETNILLAQVAHQVTSTVRIHLKNGEVLPGKITEVNDGEYLVFRTPDGILESSVRIPFDEVFKIEAK